MSKLKLILCLLTALWIKSEISAQGENNTWILGNNIALDFNSNGPSGPGANTGIRSFINTKINQSFAVKAGVSDSLGNFLFYTDGKRIFNKNFAVMENGNEMLKFGGEANITTTQIIQGSCDVYFILFIATVSEFNTSVHFTKINMNENDGLGKVDNLEKGLAFFSGSIKAIGTSSGFGKTWISILEKDEDADGKLHLFSLKDNKITFERSHDLFLPDFFPTTAEIEFSPDGTRFCILQNNFLRHSTPMYFYAFDQDNGNIELLQIYNPLSRYKPDYNTNTIACAFSPNMRYLYIIERYGFCPPAPPCISAYKLFQIELSRSKTMQLNTKFELAFVPETSRKSMTDLLLTPNNVILINRIDTNALDALISPNLRRDRAGFRSGYIEWQSGSTSLKFPNLVIPEAQLYRLEGPLDSLYLCENQSITLSVDDSYDRVRWFDGDTSFSREFDEKGRYSVELFQGNCRYQETYEISDVLEMPGLLPVDTAFCDDTEVLEIELTGNYESVIWNDGDTSPTKNISTEGYHQVAVIQNGCTFKDSFELRQIRLPQNFLATDTFICERQALFLSVPYVGAFYEWTTGASSRSIRVNDPGTFGVFIKDGKCESYDEMQIILSEKFQLIEEVETVICKGDEVNLDFRQDVVLYSDTERPIGRSFDFIEEDIYVFEYDDGPCVYYDTLNLVHQLCIEAELYAPNIFSPNNDGQNDFLSIQLNEGVIYHGGGWSIYDRSGSKIWATETIDDTWDGEFNGQPAATGVYTLIAEIEVTDAFGMRKYVQATDVTLIR